MNLLWLGLIIVLHQCLTLVSAGKKPKGQFSKIKATSASKNQLRQSNSEYETNNESEEAIQDFRFLSDKILDNLPEKGSSVEEDPLVQYDRSKFSPPRLLKGTVSSNIDFKNNPLVKLLDKKTVKSGNSQSLESNEQKTSDSANDSSDNSSVENRANENQSEGHQSISGVVPGHPPLENSKETDDSDVSNTDNGSMENGENENQAGGHQSISGVVPGPPPMENSKETDASEDSNTDNGSVESSENDNQSEGHESKWGVVPGPPPMENSKDTDASEDFNMDNRSVESGESESELEGYQSISSVVPGPPPMENSKETDDSASSVENGAKENQSEEKGGSDSSTMEELTDVKVNKLKESVESAVGLKDIQHVVPPDTFKQFLQEIKEGSKADLFNTPHFSYSNKFKDLGRRSVRQYSKAEKKRKSKNDAAEADFDRKAKNFINGMSSKSKITPKKASYEDIMTVVKASKKLTTSLPLDPEQYVVNTKSLRSGDYWDTFWIENGTDTRSLRTGGVQESKNSGPKSVQIAVMPGTKLYDLVTVLKKISPTIIYVANN